MANCEKCERPLPHEYAQNWRYCRDCMRLAQKDFEESSHTPYTEDSHSRYKNSSPTVNIHRESFWILLSRIFAWLIFFLIIVSGACYAFVAIANNIGVAILIFLGSVVGAFAAIALIMVFIDLAWDVSVIRHIFETNNNKFNKP